MTAIAELIMIGSLVIVWRSGMILLKKLWRQWLCDQSLLDPCVAVCLSFVTMVATFSFLGWVTLIYFKSLLVSLRLEA